MRVNNTSRLCQHVALCHTYTMKQTHMPTRKGKNRAICWQSCLALCVLTNQPSLSANCPISHIHNSKQPHTHPHIRQTQGNMLTGVSGSGCIKIPPASVSKLPSVIHTQTAAHKIKTNTALALAKVLVQPGIHPCHGFTSVLQSRG